MCVMIIYASEHVFSLVLVILFWDNCIPEWSLSHYQLRRPKREFRSTRFHEAGQCSRLKLPAKPQQAFENSQDLFDTDTLSSVRKTPYTRESLLISRNDGRVFFPVLKERSNKRFNWKREKSHRDALQSFPCVVGSSTSIITNQSALDHHGVTPSPRRRSITVAMADRSWSYRRPAVSSSCRRWSGTWGLRRSVLDIIFLVVCSPNIQTNSPWLDL